MYDFKEYIENKNDLIDKMNKVKNTICQLEQFDYDVAPAIEKIERAQKIIVDDTISVVLVGAFSDGKTSVVAGWLNEKLNNMKIASDESSDEILCYIPASIPEGCQIVDTPGLFGDKEDSENNKLSEKTEKYLSEANLILYVVSAKNPIKDSHKESINKILKNLNKLSSTVFVINKMDEVADLTDDESFESLAKIKEENLRGKLADCGLTSTEISQTKIVCISADPDGKGIEFWKEHQEEYLKRSRLPRLESVTNEILMNSREQLIAKTGCDILNDELNKAFSNVSEAEYNLEQAVLPELKKSLEHNQTELAQLTKRLKRSRAELREELDALEKQKISAIRAASIETIQEVLEDEFGTLPGQFGYRLDEEINNLFERYFDKHCEWIAQTGDSISKECSLRSAFLDNILSTSSQLISKGLNSARFLDANTIKNSIFAGRNLLGKLGKTIKFKPWQVTKMANFATKAIPIAGAIVELATSIITNVKEQKQNKDFQKEKDKFKTNIASLFKNINDDLNNDDKFFEKFAPEYNVLVENISKDAEGITDLEKKLSAFNSWKKTVSEKDFSVC